MKTINTILAAIISVCVFNSNLASANVLGDMQTFAPNTDGLDFITVHTGRPLGNGVWAFSNYFNYARGHLLVYKDMNTQEKLTPYNDELIEYDLDIAYGLSDNFQLFFATPILLWQRPDESQPIPVRVSKGSATYRPGFKWTLSNDSEGDSAIVASYEFLTVRDSPYVGSNPNPILNMEFAKTWKTKETKYHGLNLGYRMRKPGATPATARMFPIGDQLLASYGYSAPFTETSRWVFEVFTSMPINKDPYRKLMDASSVDILLGLKHRWVKNLNFDWGVTFEPGVESLAPQFRAFVGLVYYWKPGGTSMPVTQTAPPPMVSSYQDEPVRVIPESAEMLESSVLTLRTEGGASPYIYSVLSGPATVNQRGTVRALRPGQAEILVTDNNGRTAQSSITIRPIPRADEEITLHNLQFAFGKDKLTKSSNKIMDAQLPKLRKMNISRIIVIGHTDDVGKEEYNFELSEQRAGAIKRILMRELNLNDSQIETIGKGEIQPIATNKTDAGRAKNRRVELKIYKSK